MSIILVILQFGAVLSIEWRAFGSGLDFRVTLPVRYFYVEILDDHGKRLHGRHTNGNAIFIL